MLKGFTQYPDFVADLYYRVQYDVDFLCPETSVYRARETLRELGYEPLKEMGNFPTDHLPVMIRKTGWQWRNDYFDPDIPVSVDLHFRFWDPETEGFDAPGVDEFPSRMCSRRLGQLEFHALHAVDALGYHCLHLLRHLLRASLRLSHVYELAFFLETHKENEEFWRQWHEAHTDGLRRLEGISFRLAQLWFGCELPPLARGGGRTAANGRAALVRGIRKRPDRESFPAKQTRTLAASGAGGIRGCEAQSHQTQIVSRTAAGACRRCLRPRRAIDGRHSNAAQDPVRLASGGAERAPRANAAIGRMACRAVAVA